MQTAPRARTRVPEDFDPEETGKAAEIVATWPAGRRENEVEAFVAHHAGKGTLSAGIAFSMQNLIDRFKNGDFFEKALSIFQIGVQVFGAIKGGGAGRGGFGGGFGTPGFGGPFPGFATGGSSASAV